MLPYLYQILRTYAPIVTLPVAIVIGAVGYTLEKNLPERVTPTFESVQERRRRRQQMEGKMPEPILDPSLIVPKTILDRNLPPSLSRSSKSSSQL